MSTQLETNLAEIKRQKDTYLLPQNLRQGVRLLGVDGTLVELDTSDADATVSDIMSGKTAYVDGVKITGNYVPLDTSDANATTNDILQNKTAYVNGVKITGNYIPLDTSDANATAADIVSGKTAYVNGVKLTGIAALEDGCQVINDIEDLPATANEGDLRIHVNETLTEFYGIYKYHSNEWVKCVFTNTIAGDDYNLAEDKTELILGASNSYNITFTQGVTNVSITKSGTSYNYTTNSSTSYTAVLPNGTYTISYTIDGTNHDVTEILDGTNLNITIDAVPTTVTIPANTMFYVDCASLGTQIAAAATETQLNETILTDTSDIASIRVGNNITISFTNENNGYTLVANTINELVINSDEVHTLNDACGSLQVDDYIIYAGSNMDSYTVTDSRTVTVTRADQSTFTITIPNNIIGVVQDGYTGDFSNVKLSLGNIARVLDDNLTASDKAGVIECGAGASEEAFAIGDFPVVGPRDWFYKISVKVENADDENPGQDMYVYVNTVDIDGSSNSLGELDCTGINANVTNGQMTISELIRIFGLMEDVTLYGSSGNMVLHTGLISGGSFEVTDTSNSLLVPASN